LLYQGYRRRSRWRTCPKGTIKGKSKKSEWTSKN